MSKDYGKIVPLIELVDVIQGEGSLAGVPHVLVRVSGCPLRCMFKDSICDTPYASWDAEKGLFTLNDVISHLKTTKANHVMITGGEPTMHPELLDNLVSISHSFMKHVTVETAGFADVDTLTNIDLLSLSPKLRNSNPTGTKHLGRHIEASTNYNAMRSLIERSESVQVKFVVTDSGTISEIEGFLSEHLPDVMPHEVWLMPEGDSRESLDKRRADVMEVCISAGWNYSDRLHILAYGNERNK